MRNSLLMLLLLGLTGLASAGNGDVTTASPGPARFNISVLFQYDEADPLSWRPLFEEGSKLLYDATEKQIQLGNVTIYVNRPEMKAQADMLVSDDPDKGASAHIFGFGYQGYHMFFSQIHKSVTGRIRGQMGFVHELGHYAFGMYDEYQGSETRATASDLPLLETTKKFFCIRPQTGGVSSVMDAGTTTLNNVRTEFCYPGDHNYGRFQPADEEGGLGRIYRNKQQVQRQRSCWEQLVASMRSNWQVTVTAPTSAPVSDIAGHQPINVTVVSDVVQRTVFILDNTTDRLEALKKAASSALGGLKDGTLVGIVTLDGTTVANLTVLNAETRAQGQALIGNLTRGGAPNLDVSLRQANALLAARTPRGGNENVLLVAASNVRPSDAATSELKAAKVNVSYVTVGEDLEVAPLQELAHTTGGDGRSVPSEEQATQAVEEEARSNQGDAPIDFREARLAPGESFTGALPVDTFLTALSVELSWEEQGPFELTLVDPQGRTLLPNAVSSEDVVFRIDVPQAGEWRYTVTNRGSAAAECELDMFGTDVTTGLEVGGHAQLLFPQAQRLQVAVFAGDSGVDGAAVNGTVIRPDGSTRNLTFYDDGSAGHGDDEAHDGIYSNYFGAFTGSGIYAVIATGRNTNGTTLPSDEVDPENPSFDRPEPVAPFQRLGAFGFEANDVPATVATGNLTVRSLGLNRFEFAAGTTEGVLVERLTANLAGDGEVVLLVDDDESARAPLAGGQVTFTDAVFVEAGATRIVELNVERSVPAALSFAPAAWLLVGLAGFTWASRRQPRRAPAWAGLMLLGLLAASCGGGEDFVTSVGPSGSASGPALQLSARGITTERPVGIRVP